LKALDLLLFLSCYLTDEAKLDRLIPYVIDLLHDDAAIVRAAAIRAILQVVSKNVIYLLLYLIMRHFFLQLSLVSAITPANASIIPEYILLNSKHLTVDPDVMVRCIYAQCLVPLTDIGAIYLEMAQALKAHGPKRGTAVDVQEEVIRIIEIKISTILTLFIISSVLRFRFIRTSIPRPRTTNHLARG
jgi:phosphoinositide-3-kinase regulatory subunit 4